MNSHERQTVLAFDIGLKRTGVASGQTLTHSAHPAGQLSVKNGRFEWPKLDDVLHKWRPQLIVIGDPKTNDPHLNKAINRFKSYIQQQHKLPIVEISETLSSVAANTELADAELHARQRRLNHEHKTQLRDQIAACLILESYFNSLN